METAYRREEIWNGLLKNTVYITYDREFRNNYKNARFGRYALAFYNSKYLSRLWKLFSSTPCDAVNKLNRDFKDKKYERGHMINADLSGENEWYNMVPLTRSANSRHSTIENQIKQILRNMESYCREQKTAPNDLVLGYEVRVFCNVSGGNYIPESITAHWEFFISTKYDTLSLRQADRGEILEKLRLGVYASKENNVSIRNL